MKRTEPVVVVVLGLVGASLLALAGVVAAVAWARVQVQRSGDEASKTTFADVLQSVVDLIASGASQQGQTGGAPSSGTSSGTSSGEGRGGDVARWIVRLFIP